MNYTFEDITFENITSEYIMKSYNDLINKYENNNLKKEGVKLPQLGRYSKIPKKKEDLSKKGLSLVILYKYRGKYKSVSEIRELWENITGKKDPGGDSFQIRHLSKQYGWDIVTDSAVEYKFCLKSIEKPSSKYIKDFRECDIDEKAWYNIKNQYNFKCSHCFSIENEPLNRNPNELTILHKGHMDPKKKLTSDNCIPQCQMCNLVYQNKFIFNKNGIITGVVTP